MATKPTKLWSKGYELEPAIERYGASRNAALDAELARYDLLGSLAHARMLCKVGLLSGDDWAALDATLRALLAESAQGAALLAPGDEDIHSAVERVLVERLGPVGKKIHTARSRNDQVLVDVRLYAKEALLGIVGGLLDAAAALASLAARHEWVPMPGYTHMQRAMLSSVGLWASAHAESLLDDCAALEAAYRLNDHSPLGSAAAYGVPLPIDRAYTAELLGFAGPQRNVLAAANARGKGEAAVAQALTLVMLDLSKFAQDVLLFTTSEYDFFTAPQELCDGSSIMPQKRNLSALELVRARAATVAALQTQIVTMLVGLPSGYNMDYQETKAPFIEALHICAESLEVVRLFAERIEPKRENLQAACTAELFATDRAYEMVSAGVPFRDAYKAVAAAPAAQEPGDLQARLLARKHLGAPGNLDLSHLDARIGHERAAWAQRSAAFAHALAALAEGTLPNPTDIPNTADTTNTSTNTNQPTVGI